MAQIVESAYDGIATNLRSVAERQNSPTIHLRQFNNWVKSALIDRFCPQPNPSIFDCACGKGGDIPKFKLKNPNQYIFGDISRVSLKCAYQKYQKQKCPSRAFFIGGDIFNCRISRLLPNIRFHLASCQFAFHYSFIDEQTARSATLNLCENLVPGGHVILTVPNACRIVKLLRENPQNETINNSLYSITRKFDLDDIPMFGAEYVFNLIESVDNCPEYLVHPAVLTALFDENKCDLIETKPFHDYYHECMTSYPTMKKLFSDLLVRLGLENAEMTPDEWHVISLYSFFVFRKRGNVSPMPGKAEFNEPKSSRMFDIIDAETGNIEKVSSDV